MKKQTKKTAATPAKSKGKAKPTANAETVAPVSFPEWKADAQGIIPAPPIPPPPPVGAKVDPWRDWARRIVSRCGWSWEALEENERQPCSRAIAGWGGAVYWALAHAVKLPPARLDEAAAELEGVLVAAAEKKDCDRFCTVCNLFPETVRRLAEAPADTTPPASPSNPATPGADKPADRKKHNGPRGPRKLISIPRAAAFLGVKQRKLERVEELARRYGPNPKLLWGWNENYRESWDAFERYRKLVGQQEGLDRDLKDRLENLAPTIAKILRAQREGDAAAVLDAAGELDSLVGFQVRRGR